MQDTEKIYCFILYIIFIQNYRCRKKWYQTLWWGVLLVYIACIETILYIESTFWLSLKTKTQLETTALGEMINVMCVQPLTRPF
jgi:hypothetical protein